MGFTNKTYTQNRKERLMNSIILELSAIEDKIIDNTGMYSFEIYKKLSEILEIEKKEELRVSNIFEEFFNETIKLEKEKKYIE